MKSRMGGWNADGEAYAGRAIANQAESAVEKGECWGTVVQLVVNSGACKMSRGWRWSLFVRGVRVSSEWQ